MRIIKEPILGESMKHFEVNGLNVYVLEKKNFSGINASFVVKYGSNDICFKNGTQTEFKKYPLGIAHFLEHKMFDGNEKDIMMRKFSEKGADVNAFTSCNMTNYYFNTLENFDICMEYLCEMIYGLKLTDESVESEKLIIEQEINMYDDDPDSRAYKNLFSAMYSDHPIRNDVAGDVETIKLITRQDLEECYNSFYVNNNMFLFLIGDIYADHIQKLLNKIVINKNNNNIIKADISRFDKIHKKYIEEKMDVNVPINILGFKDMFNETSYLNKIIKGELINRMYFRATSDFYNKVYTEKIIDGDYSSEHSYEYDCGRFLFSGDGDKFKNFPDVFLDYFSKYDFSKDKENFERIKKAIYGNYVKMFNNTSSISNFAIRLIRNDANLFDYLNELKSITLNDIVEDFKNIFKESNMVYSRIV